MNIKMTQHQVAELILDILVNGLKLKSGYPMSDQHLKRMYGERNGNSADIPDGLKYAGDQKWLSYEHESKQWFLTELGHESA